MLTPAQMTALEQYFMTQEKIIAVYLYGSYARGTNNALSDIDFAVMVERGFETSSTFHLDLIGEITRILKNDNIDVQLLTPQTPPTLALTMLKGKLLYCSSPQKKVDVESQILSRYQDFQPFLKIQLEAMSKRLEKGTYAGG